MSMTHLDLSISRKSSWSTIPSAKSIESKPSEADWQQAVLMWLRWNDASEQVNEQMFAERGNPSRMEDLLTQVDELRQMAVEMSRSLLRRD